MKRENQTYARTLNRRLKGWDNSGVDSNLVNEVRENLEVFYDKYGIETDDNFFATDLNLPPEVEAEYERLMDSFGDMAGSSVNEMLRQYEQESDEYKERFNVNSFEDYMKFTDKMKQARSDRVLKNILSSDQIAELYTIASQHNISGNTVDELILFEYQSQQGFYDQHIGERGANEPLYNNMLNILQGFIDDEDIWQ